MSAHKERLYFLLQVAAHRLKTEADNVLMDAADLTTAQVAVLNLIASSKEMRQRDLARRLKQNESAITAMITRLMKADLVARRRSDTDGRTWLLELTENGKKTLKRAERPFEEINARLDATLGKKNASVLANQLDAIADEFSDSG
ncbi:MarR family transcriptional regulator [Parvibaculaceae bacterium PLY_AMNH_Bact1]|nr:MarR family transcriptional regulator [Parvibaculaceae bacterium PLY_AMNH_Bact1]